jgi:hypothetical protein
MCIAIYSPNDDLAFISFGWLPHLKDYIVIRKGFSNQKQFGNVSIGSKRSEQYITGFPYMVFRMNHNALPYERKLILCRSIAFKWVTESYVLCIKE